MLFLISWSSAFEWYHELYQGLRFRIKTYARFFLSDSHASNSELAGFDFQMSLRAREVIRGRQRSVKSLQREVRRVEKLVLRLAKAEQKAGISHREVLPPRDTCLSGYTMTLIEDIRDIRRRLNCFDQRLVNSVRDRLGSRIRTP